MKIFNGEEKIFDGKKRTTSPIDKRFCSTLFFSPLKLNTTKKFNITRRFLLPKQNLNVLKSFVNMYNIAKGFVQNRKTICQPIFVTKNQNHVRFSRFQKVPGIEKSIWLFKSLSAINVRLFFPYRFLKISDLKF